MGDQSKSTPSLSDGKGNGNPPAVSKDNAESISEEPPRKQPKVSTTSNPTTTAASTLTEKTVQSQPVPGAGASKASSAAESGTAATTTAAGHGTVGSSNVKEVASASVQRLLRSGFTETEISVSRERLNKLLKEVEPRARLTPEVEEILLQLSLRFVQSTTEFASHLATHRGSDELNLTDLRLYVEKVMGMKIPGFGSTPCGRGSASTYTYAKTIGRPGEKPEAHQKRLNLIKQTLKKSNVNSITTSNSTTSAITKTLN